MARPGKPAGTRISGLSFFALVALLVATVALVFAALNLSKPDVSSAGETPGFEPKPQSEPEAAQSEEVEETEDPEEAQEEADEPYVVPRFGRLLSVANNDLAYRGTAGPCPQTPADFQVTFDGGQTWEDRNVPNTSSLMRIVSSADGYVALVGQSAENCDQAQLWQSYGYGSDLLQADGTLASTWFPSAAKPAEVNVPNVGWVEAPCPVARLATASGESALLLCQDGRLAITGDSGGTWQMGDIVDQAASVGATAGTYLLAQGATDSCDGTQISHVNTDLSVQNVSCVPHKSPEHEIVVAGNEGSAWLWVGDHLLRSFDTGSNWQ